MSMNKKTITKRLLIGFIIWVVYMFIRLVPIPSENKIQSGGASAHQSDEITVAVTRETTDQFIEEDLTDPSVVEIIENHLTKKMKERGKQKFYEFGGTGEYVPNFSSESWSITVDGRHFAIVRINANDELQATIFIGIQGKELIKVSGFRQGKKLVPHTYGECVEKVEEIFGVDFIDF